MFDPKDMIDRIRAAQAEGRAVLQSDPVDVDPDLREALARYRGGKIADERLQGWLRSWTWEGGGSVLIGPSGIGKTTAAVHLAGRIIAEAYRQDTREARFLAESTRFVTSYDLARAWQREHATKLERWRLARILIVDDLGWEDSHRSMLPEVIHDRYRRQYVTIATSGMTAPQLVEHYGFALTRRIAESSGEGALVDCFEEPNPGGKAER